MVIAIPVDEDAGLKSRVGAHFGYVPYYALVDGGDLSCTIVQNGSSHNGGTQLPPVWLKDRGVDVLLCSGLGQRAIMLCRDCGISVYLGEEPDVVSFVEAFKDNRLRSATDSDGCAH